MKKLTDNERLIIINTKFDQWVRTATTLTSKPSVSEDLVQEAYLKLHRLDRLDKVVRDDKTINTRYFYLTLRSVCMNYLKANSKKRDTIVNFTEDEIEGIYEEDDQSNEAMGNMIDKMNDIIDNELGWFDRQLYRLYTTSNMSMQKLSDETGIAKTTIYNTVRNVKNIIRERLDEDYQDYKNGEFELVTDDL